MGRRARKLGNNPKIIPNCPSDLSPSVTAALEEKRARTVEQKTPQMVVSPQKGGVWQQVAPHKRGWGGCTCSGSVAAPRGVGSNLFPNLENVAR